MARRIAIIGLGLIGRSWAIDFARAGAEVRLWDGVPDVTDAALGRIEPLVADLAAKGLLDGAADAVMGRMTVCADAAEALDGAVYVQESTPERLPVKRDVLSSIDSLTEPDAVIASSSSGILPSAMFEGLAGAHRCLVAHPLNPPHLIAAVELAPSPATDAETLRTARATLERAGHAVFALNREIPGFVMNRLQGALLDEAFRLVDQGVVAPEDIDIALRDGLAVRWSVMGPFETIDLNAPGGVADYIDRYGGMYADLAIGSEGRVDWAGPVRDVVAADRRARLSIEDIPARAAWRDARLAEIAMQRRAQGKD